MRWRAVVQRLVSNRPVAILGLAIPATTVGIPISAAMAAVIQVLVAGPVILAMAALLVVPAVAVAAVCLHKLQDLRAVRSKARVRKQRAPEPPRMVVLRPEPCF